MNVLHTIGQLFKMEVMLSMLCMTCLKIKMLSPCRNFTGLGFRGVKLQEILLSQISSSLHYNVKHLKI